MAEQSVQGAIDDLRVQLIQQLFLVWAFFFLITGLFFGVCIALSVWWLTGKITQPIVDLNKRIERNIEQVNKIRHDTGNDNE